MGPIKSGVWNDAISGVTSHLSGSKSFKIWFSTASFSSGKSWHTHLFRNTKTSCHVYSYNKLQAPSQLPPHSAAILSPQDVDIGYYYQPQTHRLFVLQVLHVSNRKSGSEATSLTLSRESLPIVHQLKQFLNHLQQGKGEGWEGKPSTSYQGYSKTRIFPLRSCNQSETEEWSSFGMGAL